MSEDVIPLDEVELTGIDEYPPDSSIKLWGPPGTGKTIQSAARVGRLLQNYGYTLDDVAWATYRRSLALDTLERFNGWGFIEDRDLKKLHEGKTRYISTIHAVANRTVGDMPDPVEHWHKQDFCNRMDIRYQSSDPWEDTAGKLLFRTFGWMKNNLLDPSDPSDVRRCPVADDLYDEWQGDVSAVWNKWEDYKAQRGVIDFYEMLEAPIKHESVPTTDILVVDEYHDATPLMAEVCEYWIDQADITIVAGDPNQVVNAFDGADPKFFRELELPRVLLGETFRVPEEHWRAATGLLSNAHDVPAVARNSHGTVYEYRSPDFTRGDVSGWDVPGPNRRASPATIIDEHESNTLFLTRMQIQADGIGAALEQAGIPYYSQADLHGWNSDKSEPRLHLHNALQKIKGFRAGHFGGTRGLASFGEVPRSMDATELTAGEAAALLKHAHASTLVEARSDINDYCKQIRKNETPVSIRELNKKVEREFWERYTHGAASVERLNKGDLKERDRVALQNTLQNMQEPFDGDNLSIGVLTIHASKGQEAEDVVVYDGVSRRIRREIQRSERTRANEWRTWYVALTRASERLHIMRDAFEWTSPFIPKNVRQLAESGGEVAY